MLRLTSEQIAAVKCVDDARLPILRDAAAAAPSRLALWTMIANKIGARSFAEVGVHRGLFAEEVLRECPQIRVYHMIDPWRHLSDWNKPLNASDGKFADIKSEALRRTEFAGDRRRVLEGTTLEVADEIADESVDLVYVDGDHTLRGIAIDLMRMMRKVRPDGILGGDDFYPSAWQHDNRFEPTLVYPFAVHFAEAIGADIAGLPYGQYAILPAKGRAATPTFYDFTGEYKSTEIRDCLRGGHTFPRVARVWRGIWSRLHAKK